MKNKELKDIIVAQASKIMDKDAKLEGYRGEISSLNQRCRKYEGELSRTKSELSELRLEVLLLQKLLGGDGVYSKHDVALCDEQ